MLEALGLVRFSQDKLKPFLKMAVHRFGILKSKKTNLIKTEKRAIAEMLRDDKEEKARIKVEHVIRQDFTIEAYDILELYCDLVHERMRLIVFEKECPADLNETISTLIWASNRTECPELSEIANQFRLKYGKEFYERALANTDGCVNERVVQKLSIQPPTAYLTREYLTNIASEFEVDWVPTDLGVSDQDLRMGPTPAPTGSSVPVAPGSGFQSAYAGINASTAAAAEPTFGPMGAAAEAPPGYSGPGLPEPGKGIYGPPPVATATVVPGPQTPQIPPSGQPVGTGKVLDVDVEPMDGGFDIPAAPTTLPTAPSAPAPAADPSAEDPLSQLPRAPNSGPPGGNNAPPDDSDGGGGLGISDLQARLANLAGTGGGAAAGGGIDSLPSAPGVGPPPTSAPSDHDALLARFNQLKS